MKSFFIIFALISFADKSSESKIFDILNWATLANLSNIDACDKFEKYGPLVFRAAPEESKFKMSITKKFCATAPARESVKFVCKPSNDITFHNIDFYNHTSVHQLNQNVPLAFYAHGFLADCAGYSSVGLLNAWTRVEHINVCCVDWSIWSECNYCDSATDYVFLAGKYLAEIILFSEIEYGIRTKTLVGHSLGAHLIGDCGRYINNPQVPECYSIDAAGPIFITPELVDLSRRIDSSDCEKVISLCCEKTLLGSDQNLGHINILVNNGTNQPGCADDDFSCDHSSCPNYLTESLRMDRACNFTMTSVDSNDTYVFDMKSMSKYPDGNYRMTTSPCTAN